MRLLIDANVILDVLVKREPHYTDSSQVWKLCETGQAEGFISALTAANLVYVMRKELSPRQIADIIAAMKMIFRIADLTGADLSKAAEMEWNDYADAIQSVTAERIHADRIITRNIPDFSKSRVKPMTPSAYINDYSNQFIRTGRQ